MPEEFSYAANIAPYASSFFKRVDTNPYLSNAHKADLSSRLLADVEALKVTSDKQEDRSLEREIARTQLSKNRLALDDALYDSQLKREAIEQAPVANSALDSIIAELDSTKEEKTAKINQLAMRNASALAYSPVLEAKYKYALRSIESPAPAFSPYQRFTAEQTLNRDARSEERYVKAEADKEKDRISKAAESERERLDKALNVEFADDKDWIPTKEQPVAPAKKFKSPFHRENLLNLVAEKDAKNLDAYDSLDDENLFRKVSNLRRKLIHSGKPNPEPVKPLVDFN